MRTNKNQRKSIKNKNKKQTKQKKTQNKSQTLSTTPPLVSDKRPKDGPGGLREAISIS